MVHNLNRHKGFFETGVTLASNQLLLQKMLNLCYPILHYPKRRNPNTQIQEPMTPISRNKKQDASLDKERVQPKPILAMLNSPHPPPQNTIFELHQDKIHHRKTNSVFFVQLTMKPIPLPLYQPTYLSPMLRQKQVLHSQIHHLRRRWWVMRQLSFVVRGVR